MRNAGCNDTRDAKTQLLFYQSAKCGESAEVTRCNPRMTQNVRSQMMTHVPKCVKCVHFFLLQLQSRFMFHN